MEAKKPRRALRLMAVVAILAAGIALAFNVAIKQHVQAIKASAGDRVCQQIADLNSGKQRFIWLSNEHDRYQFPAGDYEFPAFIEARAGLNEAHPFDLHIDYSHNVDDLLAQMTGMRGLQKLSLYKTDVSDAGIEFVTTMPDLRAVSIGRNLKTAVTEEKLNDLRARMPQCTFTIGDDQ